MVPKLTELTELEIGYLLTSFILTVHEASSQNVGHTRFYLNTREQCSISSTKLTVQEIVYIISVGCADFSFKL